MCVLSNIKLAKDHNGLISIVASLRKISRMRKIVTIIYTVTVNMRQDLVTLWRLYSRLGLTLYGYGTLIHCHQIGRFLRRNKPSRFLVIDNVNGLPLTTVSCVLSTSSSSYLTDEGRWRT